jgi:uncharacterized protein
MEIARRDLLKSAPAGAWILAQAAGSQTRPAGSPSLSKLEPFHYRGVRLRESRWLSQIQTARDFYANIPNDDILQGFRAAAGLPAPGRPLGSEWSSRMGRASWCQVNSATVFGQWLSGMARMSLATGDSALRDKAVYLMTEWGKTVKADGDCGMQHYPFEKLVCGLVDMQEYASHPGAVPLLEKVTEWAARTFNRARTPATPNQYMGGPSEWYTLAENLWRAFQLTGNPKFREFAEVWLYHSYWNKFAGSAAPADVYGLHAYSHVNTFSSAAMTYAVTGESRYLQILRNAYDFLQNTQCYATGGFGPHERFMVPDGHLGDALAFRFDSFETVCGSWAAFKLSRYLMQFTGEARFGDWIEKLLYNGIGAALPLAPGGKNFYYSDYRLGGAMKVYRWDKFTCCSGTLIQGLAEYHNLIYFRDDAGICVNLFVPSEVTWTRPEGEVRLVQDTQYPESETTTLTLQMKRDMTLDVRFRVPGWARDIAVKINGADARVPCTPGTWAAIRRTWKPGDQVEIRFPLKLRYQAIDPQHPDRVAVVRGPVVLALEAHYHEPAFHLPDQEEDLAKWLVADKLPGVFQVVPPETVGRRETYWGSRVSSRFWPFYAVEESVPYFMYFDRKALPVKLWEP